jgi:hypothetical protein
MDDEAIWLLLCYFLAHNVPTDILRHVVIYYRRINAAKISERDGRISVYINGGICLLLPILTVKTKYNHLIIHACNTSRSLIRKATPTYKLKYKWTNLPGRYITHVTRYADIIVAMTGDRTDTLYRLTMKLAKYGPKRNADFRPNGPYEGTITKYADAPGRIVSVMSTQTNISVILQHDGCETGRGSTFGLSILSDRRHGRVHADNSRPQDDGHGPITNSAPFQALAVIMISRSKDKPRTDCAYFDQLCVGKNIVAIAYATHVCVLVDGVYYRYSETSDRMGADWAVAVSFPHPRKFVSLVCAGTRALMFDGIKYYEEAPGEFCTLVVSGSSGCPRHSDSPESIEKPRHERQLRETVPRCTRGQHPSDTIFIGNGTHPVVATLQSIYLYRTISATRWHHTDVLRGLDYICDWNDLGGL